MIVRFYIAIKSVWRVGNMQFPDDTGLAELVEIAIDCRETQTRILTLKRAINGLCRRVLISVPQNVNY